MRKLGTWGGTAMAALLLATGLTGAGAGSASAQDRAVPWLGVMTQSLDRGLRDGMDYEGEGVLISEVVDDSPAERAGLEKGDIIVSVSGRGVESPGELTSAIRRSRVGQSVSLVVFRDGRRRTISARLGERPDDIDRPSDEAMRDLRDLPRKLEKLDRDKSSMRWMTGDGETFTFPGMGRGRLGVRVEDLNSDLGSYFDRAEGKGSLIVEVLDDTPAERAGLKAGDVLVEIGDREVGSSDDVVETLRDAPEGKVSVTVLRKGARRTFEVELEEGPGSPGGRNGDFFMLRPRERRVAPDARREVRRDTRRTPSDSEDEELRKLREEIRELQEKLDRMEGEAEEDEDRD